MWSGQFRDLIKVEPTLLVHDGRYLDAALRRQRVTRDEVGAALRASGWAEACATCSVVLATDGSMTVVAAGRDR